MTLQRGLTLRLKQELIVSELFVFLADTLIPSLLKHAKHSKRNISTAKNLFKAFKLNIKLLSEVPVLSS